jgi:formyltetrahydrofolate synthetase
LTAKEYLKSIKYLDNAINAKQAELDRLRHDAESIRGIAYDKDKVQTSNSSDSMKIVDKIIELSNEINQEIDRLVDLKAEAHTKIEKVCNRKFISLLTDIYINGYTLEQVAENADKTYMTICRWHGQALNIFRKENNMS